MREEYAAHVPLLNKWARISGSIFSTFFDENYVSIVLPLNLWVELTGFSDAGDLWKDSYENENFEEEIKSLFDEVTFIDKT